MKPMKSNLLKHVLGFSNNVMSFGIVYLVAKHIRTYFSDYRTATLPIEAWTLSLKRIGTSLSRVLCANSKKRQPLKNHLYTRHTHAHTHIQTHVCANWSGCRHILNMSFSPCVCWVEGTVIWHGNVYRESACRAASVNHRHTSIFSSWLCKLNRFAVVFNERQRLRCGEENKRRAAPRNERYNDTFTLSRSV